MVLTPAPEVLVPVPLPAPALLLGCGLALLGLLRRRAGGLARPDPLPSPVPRVRGS